MLIQIIIWVLGICATVYFAGYQMFFDGGVDMIVAIVDMVRDGATLALAKTAVWGFIRMSIAGLVGWLIIFATATISLWFGEYK